MVEAVRNLVGACVAQERLLLEYLVVLVRWGTVSITDREDDGGDDDGHTSRATGRFLLFRSVFYGSTAI